MLFDAVFKSTRNRTRRRRASTTRSTTPRRSRKPRRSQSRKFSSNPQTKRGVPVKAGAPPFLCAQLSVLSCGEEGKSFIRLQLLLGRKNGVRNAPGPKCQGFARSVPPTQVSPHPWFFVSVASKGLRVSVSGLESTLTDISISVDSKGGYIALKLCKTRVTRRRQEQREH